MTVETRQHDPEEDISLIAALPGLARIGALASIRLVEWSAGAYVRTLRGLVRSAARGDAPAEVLARTGEDVLADLRERLIVSENGAGPATADAPEPAADRRARR